MTIAFKKYKLELYDWDMKFEPKEVTCEKVTEHYVWIGGRKHPKHSNTTHYFDTYEETIDAFLKHCKELKATAEHRIKSATSRIEEINRHVESVELFKKHDYEYFKKQLKS